MSRILTLIKVDEKDAVKITLEIKKDLVDGGVKEITQSELETILFRKLLGNVLTYTKLRLQQESIQLEFSL